MNKAYNCLLVVAVLASVSGNGFCADETLGGLWERPLGGPPNALESHNFSAKCFNLVVNRWPTLPSRSATSGFGRLRAFCT